MTAALTVDRSEPAGPPTDGGPPRGRAAFLRRPAVLTAVAGLMGVAWNLVVMPPPLYADSYSIFMAARQWPDLDRSFDGPLHHAMRLGTILPTKLAQVIFGEGQTAWVVTSCLLLAVLTAGTYALGRALFRKSWIGFAAVGLLLISPIMTRVDFYTEAVSNGSGGLLPDSPGAGWYCLGVAATVVASRREGRRQLVWLASAGLAYGLAYLTREFAAFMFAAIPVYFWLLRLPWRRIVMPAATMLGCLAFELAHNAVVWGDPLARLTVAGEHSGEMPRPLTPLFVLTGFTQTGKVYAIGYVFAVGLVLTVLAAVLARDRRFVLLLAWFASLWVPLTLLGGLLDPVHVSLRVQLPRYWFAIYVPLLVGGLAAIDVAVRRIRGADLRGMAAVAVAALICLVYVGPAGRVMMKVPRDADWRELRAWLAQHDEVDVLWTDDRTSQTLYFYTRDPAGRPIWHGQLHWTGNRQAELPPSVTGAYLQTKYGPRKSPAASGWREVFRSENSVVVVWQR